MFGPLVWLTPIVQAGQLELTHKGRAVYDSALPLEPAMRLYDSCSRAEEGEHPALLNELPMVSCPWTRTLEGFYHPAPAAAAACTTAALCDKLLHGRHPAGFMLDRPLVLLYSCLLQHPFQVCRPELLCASPCLQQCMGLRLLACCMHSQLLPAHEPARLFIDVADRELVSVGESAESPGHSRPVSGHAI